MVNDNNYSILKTNSHIYSQYLIQKSELKTFEKINSFEVMQKAAKASFDYIIKNVQYQKILIICGPGNNGGDGLLIAKYFNDRKSNVVIFAPLQLGKTKDSKKALETLQNNSLIKANINLEKYDLIIDCLFGVGFNRPFSQELYSLINTINKANNKIISIDIPSGIYTDTGAISSIAVKANITLTFHRLKPGLLLLPGKEWVGKIEILDIQLKNLDNETSIHVLKPAVLKEIKLSDHKYTRGTTYIIAGKKLIGASKLATLAASQSCLRAGAGVSKVFVLESDENYFKPHVLEEMIITYKNTNHLINIIKKTNISSLIYGCGIEIEKVNREILYFLLQQSFGIVLDASAFSLIKDDKENFFKLLFNRKAETILTPHKGEFEKIFSFNNDKIKDCLDASKQTNSIILYKGNDTVIASPDGRIYINSKSSPYLATSGSGDVLAGLIGGFLSQQYTGIEATRIACYIHSECGIRLKHGLIASDLIHEIPNVLKNLT